VVSRSPALRWGSLGFEFEKSLKLYFIINSTKMNIETVDNYINTFPENVQILLKQIRAIIKENVPEAEESIAYQMPAYKINGKPLVYFAGFKNHIGFYATPTGHAQFERELSKFKQGKGSVQFPLDKPIPLNLIARIVKFRVEENFIKKIKKTK
jgi:uncharacterized protein YdhG (YjbR/CyaY superfamily)